ncbi:MAG: hypothetical protein BA863_06125 [Desulfovibrio sp. S3730MH75]|nr:MAG: hypothetical protein BA863_06125 [Desulfovibrio sp. S3730MH75]
MNETTTNTGNHISPKDRALLDDFMDETSSFDTSNSITNIPSASPEALLSLLKDTKKLVNSLHSGQEPTEQGKEIISRLKNVELELADLKSKVAAFINNN